MCYFILLYKRNWCLVNTVQANVNLNPSLKNRYFIRTCILFAPLYTQSMFPFCICNKGYFNESLIPNLRKIESSCCPYCSNFCKHAPRWQQKLSGELFYSTELLCHFHMMRNCVALIYGFLRDKKCMRLWIAFLSFLKIHRGLCAWSTFSLHFSLEK